MTTNLSGGVSFARYAKARIARILRQAQDKPLTDQKFAYSSDLLAFGVICGQKLVLSLSKDSRIPLDSWSKTALRVPLGDSRMYRYSAAALIRGQFLLNWVNKEWRPANLPI